MAKRLIKIGYSLVATAGTAEALSTAGIPVKTVNKIAEGRPNVVDIIKNKEVALVINTPSGTRAQSDGWAIRSAATEGGIPIITTLAAAKAATTAMELSQKENWTIRSIQDYYQLIPTLSQKSKRSSKMPVN